MSLPDTPSRVALAAMFCAAIGTVPSALAAGQVAGPVQVGPSWAQADAAHSTALLNTIVANHGPVTDRLIRVECPASGHVALRNGTLHRDVEAPNVSQQQQGQAAMGSQNGLDVPPALHGRIQPVTAQFDLTQAIQPLTDGALVPCTVNFAHAGERIVIFTVGEQPTPTSEP